MEDTVKRDSKKAWNRCGSRLSAWVGVAEFEPAASWSRRLGYKFKRLFQAHLVLPGVVWGIVWVITIKKTLTSSI